MSKVYRAPDGREFYLIAKEIADTVTGSVVTLLYETKEGYEYMVSEDNFKKFELVDEEDTGEEK